MFRLAVSDADSVALLEDRPALPPPQPVSNGTGPVAEPPAAQPPPGVVEPAPVAGQASPPAPLPEPRLSTPPSPASGGVLPATEPPSSSHMLPPPSEPSPALAAPPLEQPPLPPVVEQPPLPLPVEQPPPVEQVQPQPSLPPVEQLQPLISQPVGIQACRPSLLEVLGAEPNATFFVQALQAAGMAGLLDDPAFKGTVFVPTGELCAACWCPCSCCSGGRAPGHSQSRLEPARPPARCRPRLAGAAHGFEMDQGSAIQRCRASIPAERPAGQGAGRCRLGCACAARCARQTRSQLLTHLPNLSPCPPAVRHSARPHRPLH